MQAAQASVVIRYDAGQYFGTPGAADDPVNQDWTRIGVGGNQFADGYSDGNSGWRIVDGTGTAPIYYQHDFGVAKAGEMDRVGFEVNAIVKFDSDAIGSSGGFVDDYYYPPNHGRQNNVTLWFETTLSPFYRGAFNVDAASNLFFNDGTVNHQLTTDGSAYDNYKRINITAAPRGGTTIMQLGSTSVVLNSQGAGTQNRIVFGSSSSAGQGSSVWNYVNLNTTIPEPETMALLLVGVGLTTYLRRSSRPKLDV